MAQVYRILMMDLNQIPFCIVHLLVESKRNLMGVYIFDIADPPA